MSNGLMILLLAIVGSCGGVPICELPRDESSVGREPAGPILAQLRPLQDRNEGTSLSPAQQRIQARRLLRDQIKTWRAQARQIPAHLAQQTLEEKPDWTSVVAGGDSSESRDRLADLEVIVRSNTGEVVLQFVREMKIPADPWEQAYVGRTMVALLERAYEDQLAGQDRMLLQVLASGPNIIRELPKPGVEFPPTQENGSVRSDSAESNDDKPVDEGNSEAYLTELRRAQEDAQKRNAQDELIMRGNRATEAFYRDFLAMIIRSKSPNVYNAVLERVIRQLRTGDAAFQQTVQVLSKANLTQLSLRQLRPMRTKLGGLSRQFRGVRQYTVYAEVQKQVRTQSNFERRELDFSQSVADLLAKLDQQIELSSQRELRDRRQRTPARNQTESPELLERTPGPND